MTFKPSEVYSISDRLKATNSLRLKAPAKPNKSSALIWGLQLAVINEPLFDKDSNVKAKRTKVKEAKAADPRLIELVCLKNRNGKPSFSCGFNYYPKFDLFKVDQNELSWEGVTSERL